MSEKVSKSVSEESKNSRRKQWLTVIAGAILMLSFGGLYAWSVIVPSLQQFTGASLTSLSAVFSVAVISFTIAMVVGPSFYYRFDASTTTKNFQLNLSSPSSF
ncbi:MAG: OFA family MFS transporter [Richelia sp. SL_2_1]|nr:OFA family MFS transporter [Richelia sp. RM1_1_1]NJO30977.1 OFA family MFS transporter [Richelia sp. SL_2_1]